MDVFLIAFAYVVGAVALAVFWFFGPRRARMVASWPGVAGTIVQSRVETNSGASDAGSGATYHAHVRYEYVVDGNTHEAVGVRGRWISGSGDRGRAQRICDRYPAGADVTVFHDPEDPTRACLEKGVGSENMGLAVFGVVALVAGTVLLVFGSDRVFAWFGG